MLQVMRRLFTVLVLGALAASAHGQAAFSILPPGITMLPTYANANTAVSFAYTLQYNGSTPFTGNLYTYSDVNGSGTPQVIDTISLSNFNPGASHHDTVHNYLLSANPGPFSNGRNGIVIWVADDNFSAISDSTDAEILVVCGPAFRITNTTNGIPTNGILGCDHDFDIDITNVHENCYKDTLYLNCAANGNTPIRVATPDQVQLPYSMPTIVRIEGFPFSQDVFHIGWNALRMWATGRDGCFAADTLGLSLYIASSSTGVPDPDQVQVLAWPNPCYDHLQLSGKMPPQTRLELVDALGHQIPLGDWRTHIDLQALRLSPGTYTLRLLPPGKPAVHIPLSYIP
jgi:hypothetical protein